MTIYFSALARPTTSATTLARAICMESLICKHGKKEKKTKIRPTIIHSPAKTKTHTRRKETPNDCSTTSVSRTTATNIPMATSHYAKTWTKIGRSIGGLSGSVDILSGVTQSHMTRLEYTSTLTEHEGQRAGGDGNAHSDRWNLGHTCCLYKMGTTGDTLCYTGCYGQSKLTSNRLLLNMSGV